MVFTPTPELWAQFSNASADNTPADYSNNVASHQDALNTLKSAPFLNDLRDHYAGEGIYENDEDLIDRLYSDQAWRTFNTLNAGYHAFKTQYTTSEERQRLSRIEKVFRALPNPWDEGGRGWGEAALDVVVPIATDPTNLLGGASALGKGMLAAKTAREVALASGVAASASKVKTGWEGAKVAGKIEGGISAGQEIAMDTSEQYRDRALGLQEDEHNFGRTAVSGVIGGAMGYGVGAIIGALGAVIGVKRAESAFANARASGLTDNQITDLGVEGLKKFARLDEGVVQSDGRILDLSHEEKVKYGLSPDGSFDEGWEEYNPNYQPKAPSKFVGDDGEMKTRGEPDPDDEALKDQILNDIINEGKTKAKDGADKKGWHKDAAAKAEALKKLKLRRAAGKEITEAEESALKNIKPSGELPDVRGSFDAKGNYVVKGTEETPPTGKTTTGKKTEKKTEKAAAPDPASTEKANTVWNEGLSERVDKMYTKLYKLQMEKAGNSNYDEDVTTAKSEFANYFQGVLKDNPDVAEELRARAVKSLNDHIADDWQPTASNKGISEVNRLYKAEFGEPETTKKTSKKSTPPDEKPSEESESDWIEDNKEYMVSNAYKLLRAAYDEEPFEKSDIEALYSDEAAVIGKDGVRVFKKQADAFLRKRREQRAKEAKEAKSQQTSGSGRYFTEEEFGQLFKIVAEGETGVQAGKGGSTNASPNNIFTRINDAKAIESFSEENDISYAQLRQAIDIFRKENDLDATKKLTGKNRRDLEERLTAMKEGGEFTDLSPTEEIAIRSDDLTPVIEDAVMSLFHREGWDVRTHLNAEPDKRNPVTTFNKLLGEVKDSYKGDISEDDIRSRLDEAFDPDNEGVGNPTEVLDGYADIAADNMRAVMDEAGVKMDDPNLTNEMLESYLSDPDFKELLDGFDPAEIVSILRPISDDVGFSKQKTSKPKKSSEDRSALKGIEFTKTERTSRRKIHRIMMRQHPDLSSVDAWHAATAQIILNRNAKNKVGDVYTNIEMLEKAARFAVQRVMKEDPNYVPLGKLTKENFLDGKGKGISKTHQRPRMIATAQSLANISGNKQKGYKLKDAKGNVKKDADGNPIVAEPKSIYVSYVVTNPSGETVISKAGENGLERMPKGSTVWVVGSQPNAVDRFEVAGIGNKGIAYKSRGYGFRTEADAKAYYRKEKPQTQTYKEMVKEGSDSIEAKNQGGKGGGALAKLAQLAALQKKGDASAIEALANAASKGTPSKPSALTPPPRQGNDLAIIKHKKTGEVRMLSQNQFDNGEDVGDLMGRSDPKDWLVRYAPYTEWVSSQSERTNLFNDPSRSNPLEPRLDKDRRTRGFESGKGKGLDKDRAINTPVTIPEEAVLALRFGSAKPEEIKNAYDLYIAITRAESAPWKEIEAKTMAKFSVSLSHAYSALSEATEAHGGVALFDTNLDAAKDSLNNIYSGFHPEAAKQAIEFIESVERTTGTVPNIRPERNLDGASRGGGYNGRSGVVSISDDPKFLAQKSGAIIETLYHETAHWGYHNILTPEDRMMFWKAMGKYENNADLVRKGVGQSSGNAMHSPQEFFANQFAAWMMRQIDPNAAEVTARNNIFAHIAAEDSGRIKHLLRVVKAVIYKAVFDVDIDPDLTPLFMKISSPDTRSIPMGKGVKTRKMATFESMKGEVPTTRMGKVVQRRFLQLNFLRSDIEKTISNRLLEQSDSTILEPTGSYSASDLIENTQLYLKELHSIFANSADINVSSADKKYYTGVLSIMKGPNPQKTSLSGIAFQRMNDIYRVLSGRPVPDHVGAGEEELIYTSAFFDDDLTGIANPEEVADYIAELWMYGGAGNKNSSPFAIYDAGVSHLSDRAIDERGGTHAYDVSGINRMNLTSLAGFTDVMERQYINAWNKNEKGQRFTTNLIEYEARKTTKEKLAKESAAILAKAAASDKKGKSSPPTALGIESALGLDFDGLVKRYVDLVSGGYDVSDIQATLIHYVRGMPFENDEVTKAHSDFAKGKLTKVPDKEGLGDKGGLSRLRKDDIEERLGLAIRDISSAKKKLKVAKKGSEKETLANRLLHKGSDDLENIVFELQRRAFNTDLKGSFDGNLSPIVSDQILIEVAEREGVISESGIPNGASIPMRHLLEKITHRDHSPTQAVARTMAYRLMQMSETDLESLPTDTKEFNSFRNNVRGLASGLSAKSTVPPQEVMDDVIDTVILSAMRSTDGHFLRLANRLGVEGNHVREWVKDYIRDLSAVNESDHFRSMDLGKQPMPAISPIIANADGQGYTSFITGKDEFIDIDFETTAQRFTLDVYAATKYLLNNNTSRRDIKQAFPSLFTGDLLRGMIHPTPFLNGLESPSSSNSIHLSHYFQDLFGKMKRENPTRLENIKQFSYEWDDTSNSPVIWHFTPSVDMAGMDKVYLKKARPMPESVERRHIEEVLRMKQSRGDLSDRVVAQLEDLYGSFKSSRKESSNRSRYFNNILHMEGVQSAYPRSRITELANRLSERLREEERHVELLIDHGLLPEIRTQSPVVVGADELADMRNSSMYSISSSSEGVNGTFVYSFVRALTDLAERNPEKFVSLEDIDSSTQDYWLTLESFATANPKDSRIRGSEVLSAAKYLIDEVVNIRSDKRWILTADSGDIDLTAQEIGDDLLHDVFREMGYDAVIQSGKKQGSERPSDEMIVLDTSKVKMLDDPSFNDDQSGLAPLMSDSLVAATTERTKAPAALAASLQANGTDPSLGSAAMSLLKGRELKDRELATLHKWSPMQWFHSQSVWMKDNHFNWLSGWYDNHFPDLHQLFASKYYPLSDVLRKLPDSHGAFKSWMHKSNPTSKGKGGSQPKSHAKILRALRHGEESRQEQALTDGEREAYHAIREAFIHERDEMVAQGIFVGDRKNYVPQVWDKAAITSDRPKFAIAMMEYYKTEKLSSGEDIDMALLDQEALEFAQKLYFRLTKEDADGILLGDKSSHTQSTMSDHIDFSRVVELEKHPELFEVFEPFLENNLESILVKYLEGTSRRISHIKKMGNNGHAFYDYMTVATDGAKGIAKLLSTDKVFDNIRTGLNEDHQAELMSFVQTIPMPFANNQAAAMDFANGLIAQYQTDGIAGIRQSLEEIGYRNQFDSAGRKRGELSLTYQRRIDAIVGAIQDFKGKPTQFNRDVANKLTDSMKVVMKRPLSDNEALTKFSKRVRAFNSITLLSYVTLTSIGDPFIAAMRTGSLKHSFNALKNIIKDDGDYRAMVRNTGVAMENIVHERLMYMYGGSNGNVSNAFFNATLLTPWTDMNRQLAGATGYELFKAEQKRAARHYKAGVPLHEQSRKYKSAHRLMNNYGLGDWLPEGPKANSPLDLVDMKDNEDVRIAIVKFTDDTIFQPNPNEVPIWAQTPVGAMIFQLKSFPVMMSRLSSHAINEARLQNYAPLMALLTIGPAAGSLALTTKDHLQSRGGEDEKSAENRIRTTDKLEGVLDKLGYDKYHHGDKHEFLAWYIEGQMVMGGLGYLADLFHNAAVQKEHGAYGIVRGLTALSPALGIFADALSFGYGWGADAPTNAKARSGARAATGRVPFIGGNKYLKEQIVDAWAGESESREGLRSNLKRDIKSKL